MVDTSILEEETPQVWTLVLTGGLPFQINIPMSPLLEHDGTWSLWKVHGTLGELQQIQAVIQKTGAVVSSYTESQTMEQKYERMELLGLDPTEPVVPTPDTQALLEELETFR